MKNLLYTALFALLVTVNLSAQEKIKWVTLEEAVTLQKKKPKKIIMDVYTSWCGPCKMLDRNTFGNKDVAEYINQNYYAVKFNAEGDEKVNFKDKVFENPNYDPAKASRRNSSHQLARYFSVKAYPTIVFLDEKAELIAPITGYKTPQQLELYIKMFNKNEHLTLTTQEAFNNYYKAFSAEFNN